MAIYRLVLARVSSGRRLDGDACHNVASRAGFLSTRRGGRAMPTKIRWAALAAATAASLSTAHAEEAKPASPATVAAQRAVAAALPADDGRDAAFAAQGFVGTRADPLIKAADGHTVWNLAAYNFVTGQAP